MGENTHPEPLEWRDKSNTRKLMSSPAFVPFNAPPIPEVEHDRRLVRRYLLQSALRFNAGSLLFLSLAIALLPLWLNFGTAVPGDFAAHKLTLYMVGGVVLAVMAWFALMSSGIARSFLARLGEEGKALCAEGMASSVMRRIDAPFNSYITFDLCTESLSGLALGTALGYSGPPAFFHDPFKGRIVLGRWRPLALGRHVEVRVSSELGPCCHIELRCRPGLAWFAIQQGESLKAAEMVCDQLRQHLARHANALDAARRERELERTSLQARLSALQAQVEPHFLFNALASLQQLIRSQPATAERFLGELHDYLRLALPSLRQPMSTLDREFELASAYLTVMATRLGARLRFGLQVQAGCNDHKLPPLMLLTLVENAVRHGIEPKPQGGRIDLEARREGERFVLEVRDDGLGLQAAASSPTQGQGLGLANVRDRLAGLYGEAARLSVQQRPAGGVCARIELAWDSAETR